MANTVSSLQERPVRRAERAPRQDLTRGSLHRSIWVLAVPMVLELSVLSLAQAIDTYLVGNELGSAALAAVTIGMNLRWVFNSLANGLGIGGLAVVARRVGAGDEQTANHAAAQTILLAIFVSLVLGVSGTLLARPAMQVLGARDDVLTMGVSYLRVLFGGLWALVLFFVVSALLRGAGEARLAMLASFVGQGMTILLDLALILGWGPLPRLGVLGSAWASVLGFGSGLLVQLLVLVSGRARITFNPRKLRPDLPLMGHIVKIALPSTIQMTLRSSSRLAILAIIGFYGTFATAAFGVANRVLLIALIPCFGLGNAAGTLVGQNMGASKSDRAERSAWWVAAYNVGLMIIFTMMALILARPLIAFFDPTSEVVAIGADALRIIAPSMILSAIGVALARGFDGAGNTIPAMAVNLLTLWVLEVPLAYGLSRWLGLGLNGVWIGRAMSNAANGVVFAFWFRLGRWKRKRV